MGVPIPLRSDFDAASLRGLARTSTDAKQTRRLLSLAAIYEGASRRAAAEIGGVGLQVIRDWTVRFNAGGPAELIDRKAPGQRPKLDAGQRGFLVELVEQGPIPAVHGVVRWRLKDLVQLIQETFGISMDETTMGRELRALGFRKLSARPRHHAQNEFAVEAYKKTSPPSWTRSAPRSRKAPR